MPFSVTTRRDVVTFRFSGFVTVVEFLGGAMALNAHEDFESIRYIVNDFLDIDGHEIDTASVLEALAVNSIGAKRTNPDIRVVVVTEDDRIIAMAKAMSAQPYDDAHEVRHFPTMSAAQVWMATQPLRTTFPPRD